MTTPARGRGWADRAGSSMHSSKNTCIVYSARAVIQEATFARVPPPLPTLRLVRILRHQRAALCMDFNYTPQEDAFRRELRAWLAANLPKDFDPDGFEELTEA